MHRVQKFHGPDRQVLRDIWLSFYPGAEDRRPRARTARARARCCGSWRASTRTSRRRPAGHGATRRLPAAGAELDPAKDVRGNVEEAVAPDARRCSTASTRSMPGSASRCPTTRWTTLLEEQGEVQDADRGAPTPGTSTASSRSPWTRCACPPGDADVDHALRRRAAPGRALPVLLQQPDLLLLDEPTNHLDAESVAWLERHLARVPRHGRRRHPRPLLPRQRRRLDPRARPRPAASPGRATTPLARAEAGAARARGEAGDGPPADARTRAGVGAHGPARPPGQEQGPPRSATSSCWPRSATKRDEASRSTSPPARSWATSSSRPSDVSKGYGDRLLFEDLTLPLPPGGIVGVIGPNGAGKTTLFRMIVGQEKPDGGDAPGRRHRRARLRRPEPRRARPGEARSARRSPAASTRSSSGKRGGHLARLRRAVQLQGAATSRRRSATSRAASGTASTWPSCSRAAATCCCSTSRPTTSTSTCSARSKRPCVDFAGCAVVISHDRWFLDRIATHILAFEGDSQVVWCEGNYQAYEAEASAAGRRGRPARTGSSTSRFCAARHVF